MIDTIGQVPLFAGVAGPIRDLAAAAKVKTETLRTDPEIFDIWSSLVTAGERLANFTPGPPTGTPSRCPPPAGSPVHSVSDGLHLLRAGRDLVFYITRARTPMPKSTREYIERCQTYLAIGSVPFAPVPLPA